MPNIDLAQINPVTDATAARLASPAAYDELASHITAEPLAGDSDTRPAWPRRRRRLALTGLSLRMSAEGPAVRHRFARRHLPVATLARAALVRDVRPPGLPAITDRPERVRRWVGWTAPVAAAAALAALAVSLTTLRHTPNAAPRASAAATASTGSSTSSLLLGLNGVSCASAKFCAAVGTQGDTAHLSRGDVPLTMIWNGAGWRKTATPLPRGWPQGELDSVSCPSAAYCVAFGDSYGGTTTAPLAETWNGRAWTLTALPGPPASGRYLRGGAVSCGAPGSCIAVRNYYATRLSAQPFVLTLSGTRWTVRQVPLPKGSTSAGFGSVSCVSRAYCVLAGSSTVKHPMALFESWNGSTFAEMRMASSAAPFPEGSVACASANNCAAIGTSAMNGPFNVESVAAIWNGTAWSIVDVPRRNGVFDALASVSCASATSCVAAGVASTDGREQTSHALAASYDGRTWTIASVPVLAHGGTSEFHAVSCPSANYCVAVGEGGGPGGTTFSNAALTGFWNGKTWKLVSASLTGEDVMGALARTRDSLRRSHRAPHRRYASRRLGRYLRNVSGSHLVILRRPGSKTGAAVVSASVA